MMQTFVRPSRDLRNHYAEIADMTKNHNHVIITNQGRGESVLINIEDYAKYEEFLHQRYVAEELAKAKALAKAAGAAAATACKRRAVNCVCPMKSAVCVTMSACC